MLRKSIGVLGTLIMLLALVFGSVGAQGETPEDPSTTPTVQPGSKFFTHPVVKVLSEYFDREMDEEETPTDPANPGNPEEAPAPEEETESGLGPIGEEIAAYHEEGMGFGVLVKIYAMAEASRQACASVEPVENATEGEEACTPVTAEELITAFKGGKGMGLLFKEYGKPALLGVGHVKQELKKLENQPADETETELDTDQKENKPDKNKPPKEKKDKSNNGKGPHK